MSTLGALEKPTLGTLDYAVLVVMLSVSLLIGVYYAWVDRKKQSNAEFLMGGRNMSVFPVALSLMASFLSSTTILGWPTEIYTKGTQALMALVSCVVASVVAAEVFVPIFYRLNLTSVNKYLSDRYDSHLIRTVASVTVLLSTLPYLGIVLFGPSLALGAVTGLTVTQSVFIMGVICTVYTTLGGLKAVIWTDVIQYCLMFIGLIVVLIKGSIDAGGINEVFRKASLGGRLEFFNMDFDIYNSSTFWTVIIGTSLIWTGAYGSNQMQVQRTSSMPSLRKAKEVIYVSLPGFQLMLVLVCYLGLVIFANYSHCDALKTGQIKRADELVPFFVAQSLGNDYPGLPGLFVACVFSSSLSTLSSGFNAMAAITWDDFLRKHFTKIPENKSVYITKAIAALIGIICIGAAFMSSQVGTVFEASIVLSGAPVGPLFAIFFMGMFYPCVNAKGAIAGLLGGQMACLWVTVGGIMSKKPSLILPTSTEHCNATLFPNLVEGVAFDMLRYARVPTYIPEGINKFYHISHFMVPVFGFLITMSIGVIVSLLTGRNRGRTIDPRLINGLVNKLRGADKVGDATHGIKAKDSIENGLNGENVLFLTLKPKSANFDD